MGLGIITLFFLVCFTLLYISKGLTDKPGWLNNAAEKITTNIDVLAFWGFVYSLVSAILAPLVIWGGYRVVTVFLSDAVLFLLTLPFVLDSLLGKYGEKIPAPISNELRNIALAVSQRQRVMGYIGAGFSFLLFIVLFR